MFVIIENVKLEDVVLLVIMENVKYLELIKNLVGKVVN